MEFLTDMRALLGRLRSFPGKRLYAESTKKQVYILEDANRERLWKNQNVNNGASHGVYAKSTHKRKVRNAKYGDMGWKAQPVETENVVYFDTGEFYDSIKAKVTQEQVLLTAKVTHLADIENHAMGIENVVGVLPEDVDVFSHKGLYPELMPEVRFWWTNVGHK